MEIKSFNFKMVKTLISKDGNPFCYLKHIFKSVKLLTILFEKKNMVKNEKSLYPDLDPGLKKYRIPRVWSPNNSLYFSPYLKITCNL